MHAGIRWLGALIIGAAALGAGAATTEEAAAAAAEKWAKAISTRDIDAEMKLLPPTMYTKPGERDRQRSYKLRDKEMALVSGDKYLSFQMRPPIQTAKIGKMTAVVVPYTAERFDGKSRLLINSSAIALTLEGGSEWYVIDGTGQVTRSLKLVIPGYNGELALPPAMVTAVKPQ